MEFTEQELAFFQQVFSENTLQGDDVNTTGLSLRSELPDYVASLFEQPGLCMLAEVGHFELWFPLSLSLTANGDLQPALEAPEIFEALGQHRSWRFDNPTSIYLLTDDGRKLPIHSLSSTGAVIDAEQIKHAPQRATAKLILPDYPPMQLEMQKARQQGSLIAVTFTRNTNKKQLRQFLFDNHKQGYQEIYHSLAAHS